MSNEEVEQVEHQQQDRAAKKLRTDMDCEMEVDGKISETEQDVEIVKQQVKVFLLEADLRPPAPDAQTFLDHPFDYNPNSPCLHGTIDSENNTALICAVKGSCDPR